MNASVAAGEVITQNPDAYEWADPDQPIVLTVSTGNQDPSQIEQEEPDNTMASGQQSTSAAANGEVWKCTQSLNTPVGYSGGFVRLELVQEVDGVPTSSVVTDGQILTFPYDLDITGIPGVSKGVLYISEQINGTYQQLGQYEISFEKVDE